MKKEIAEITETALAKISVRFNQQEEARAALTFVAAVALENAGRELTLETLAEELSLPDVALADSPRSRRNARRRGRAAWLSAALDPLATVERKTNAARASEIERSLNRDAVRTRALEKLTLDALTRVVFDAETGLPCYDRERVAETVSKLVAESSRLSAALRRVGAYSLKKSPSSEN